MKWNSTILSTLTLFFIATASSLLWAAATPGQAAPDFDVSDINGKQHKLSDYAGKWLVLEWYNKDCPYVKKHYKSGNMQNLQKKYTAKGVTWLAVASSAKGKEGFMEPAEALKVYKSNQLQASALVLDPTGVMGKAYGAKTTPHMFVINPKGVLVYAGAIDDNDSADPSVIAKSKNYVSAALDAGLTNQPIRVSSSMAYGCSVKY